MVNSRTDGRIIWKEQVTINEHISNVFKEKELQKTEVMRKFGISEFSTKPTNFYNLYVIISVDYRVGFEAFKLQYGYNRFVMSPTKWIENTNAIGFITKDGKSLKKGINYIFNFEFFK